MWNALIGTAMVNALMAVVMVALYDVAFPAWATGPARSSTQVVGFAFTANSVGIVVSQLLVLRYLLEGRRRTRMSAIAALIFGTACLFTLIAGPAVAGAALARGMYGTLFVGLAVTCGFGALLGLWLERVIPAAANLTSARPKVERPENSAEG